MQIGGLGSIPYRTVQFSNEQNALWQVVENRTPANAEFRIASSECSFEIQRSLFDVSQWGCSSVGRAVALQAIGQEFESPQLHQSRSAGLPRCSEAKAGG